MQTLRQLYLSILIHKRAGPGDRETDSQERRAGDVPELGNGTYPAMYKLSRFSMKLLERERELFRERER